MTRPFGTAQDRARVAARGAGNTSNQSKGAGAAALRNLQGGTGKSHKNLSMYDAFGAMERHTILTYPEDVDMDESQGHYILFEIYEQDPAKLASTKAIKHVKGQLDAAEEEVNTDGEVPKQLGPPAPPRAKEDHATEGGAGFVDEAVSAAKGVLTNTKPTGPNSIQVRKNATTKNSTTIALYMPPSVQVSYGATYNEQEIGAIAESANAAIAAFSNTEGGIGSKLGAAGGVGVGGLITGGVAKLKQMAPTGAEAIFAINTGSVITPRMELMFEGIQRRSFSFNFDFIPRSAKEAKTIEDIVYLFKYHMSSNYGRRGAGISLGGVDGVREMTIPDFFQITYMYLGDANPHLNLIKKCVLLNTSVEYGADRFKAFANGQPQTTKLGLNFSELEIITKDYVKQGY